MRIGNKVAVIVLVLFSLFFISCSSAKENEYAPDFKLEDLESNSVKLSDYKGKKPVILFFWTTWCSFCRQQIRSLNARYSQSAADGILILAINSGENRMRVNRFIKNYSIFYPVLLDLDAAVARAYQVVGVPTYVFIDKKGNLIYKGNYFFEKYYRQLLHKDAR